MKYTYSIRRGPPVVQPAADGEGDGMADGFPVAWSNPANAGAFWFRDDVHFPRPVSPMGAALLVSARDHGIAHAARELALPVRLRSAVLNHYVYLTAEPLTSPTDLPARLAEMNRRMETAISALPGRWETEYRPELEQLAARCLNEDLAALGDREVGAALDRLRQALERQWQIHFLVVFPIFHAGGELARAYTALTGDTDVMAPYALLRGLPNATLDADAALHAVARAADTGVAAMLRDRAPDLPRTELLATEAGRHFLSAFDRFLARYGRRSTSTDDLIEPTWAEAPGFVLARVRDWLNDGAPAPEDRNARVADEATRARARIVAAGDERRRAGFDAAFARACAVWPLRETHTEWIDQVSPALCRRWLRAIGRRPVSRGVLPTWEDALYLTPEEVRRALAGEGGDWAGRAATVRQEMARWASVRPPETLGVPSPDAPPPDPELLKFFGHPVAPPSATVLHGIAASGGVRRGPARVALSLADLERVRPGDVLVCPATTPPWTPLFPLIAALVTDAGGVLSHGALMAREYGLPAVTGTRHGTRTLRDGQIVEVDGDAGVVRVLEDASPA